MNKLNIQTVLIGFSMTWLFCLNIYAQQLRQIVPLETKCEDLKKILNVQKCSLPFSYYKFEGFSYMVDFSTEKDDWDVSDDTVTRITITLYKKLLRPTDFELNLDYAVIPNSCTSGFTYKNEKAGIAFSTGINAETKEEWVN